MSKMMNKPMRKNEKTRRVLVVGSWAKEEITIANMKRFPGMEVYCYMDTDNPGIRMRADGFRIGRLNDVAAVLDYARETDVHLTLITTAAPLAAGLVDAMMKENMKVFGPTREAARLETDKAFTRELVRQYIPGAVPAFKVCDTVEEAVDFARELDWRVAVKPVGLTDGLGVKVFGVQLADAGEVEAYIDEIHNKKIGGDSHVIVEERMKGEEFTVQCFVYNDFFVPTPAVQDFKKLLNGEQGPNTASMGSYSDSTRLLPFMNNNDYQRALEIIKKTLAAFRKETGQWCSGFLYGQFMLCKDGVKLVEYNFRPGDPEWMNTVSVLQDNIADVVEGLMEGKRIHPTFQRKATVCKYIVPPEYPYKLNQVLDVSLEREKIKDSGTEIYWSCGLDESGKLKVGSERGIAFLALGDTISEANRKIETAVSAVKGNFHYRSDIATPPLLRTKIESIKEITGEEMRFRTAKGSDFMDVHDFVCGCPPLENYAEHVYKILLRYFGNSCIIAEIRNRVVGYVLGFISQTHFPKTYFLWQIGVAPYMQGTGLGTRLLQYVETHVNDLGCKRIEATIDPVNISSQKLFEKLEFRNISETEGKTVKVKGKIAVKDYYKPGRHFMLYAKELK